jgi:hypothetical protein
VVNQAQRLLRKYFAGFVSHQARKPARLPPAGSILTSAFLHILAVPLISAAGFCEEDVPNRITSSALLAVAGTFPSNFARNVALGHSNGSRRNNSVRWLV